MEKRIMTDVNAIEAALRHLDSHDREQWVRIGAAIKTELGEDGFNIWNDWSAEASNYNPKAAANTWKSLKPGFVNIGTLFYEARQKGYQPSSKYVAPTDAEIAERKKAIEAAQQRAVEERKEEMAEAKEFAQQRYSELEPIRNIKHDYLVRKGIDDPALLRQVKRDGDNLVIPLKINGQIVGLQEINKTGFKSFTKGLELKGSSLVMGSWANRDKGIVLTEGYATAASIHKATGLTTVICFAGFNLAEVAKRLPKNLDVPIIIAADNDLPDKSGVRSGIKHAEAAKEVLGDKATVIEPQFTEQDFKKFEALYGNRPSDFNDLHKLHGLDAVSKQFNPKKEFTMEQREINNASNEAKRTGAENSIAPDIEKIMAQHAERDINNPIEHSEPNSPSAAVKKSKPIDLDKELTTPVILDHNYDHPPGQLKTKYVFTEKGDYVNDRGDVFFKDKGTSLATTKNDINTIRDMLSVAEVKGWSSIHLTGSKEFRRLAYLEAASRGIETTGYKPNEKDQAILNQMLEERSLNKIQSAEKTQNVNKENSTEPELTAERSASVDDLTLGQQEAEKAKILNQNRGTSSAVIEDSARVDEHGADIPMSGVGSQEIRDEVLAFMNGLTPKQRGLNKSSMFILRTAKEAVKPIISGLKAEQRDQAIRNFNEKIDQSIEGQTLNLSMSAEQSRPAPVKEQDRAREAKLER